MAVINHHPTIKNFDYPIYINKKSSSTSKLIYDIIKKEDNIFMWVFIVVDIKNEKTLEYRIYSNKVDLLHHDFIASRGTNIMPAIELLINKKVEV